MCDIPPKQDRIEEFLRRLDGAPPANSFEEAFSLLSDTLNAVEDELTGIPYDPNHWQTDGRMYPPQADNIRTVPESSGVKRLRTRGHDMFVGSNGAIEIEVRSTKQAIFAKVGGDGRGVWEL
jgi:hypothetical protein